MSDDQLRYRLDNLGQALTRLEEAMAVPVDPQNFMLDTVIKRFEFTFELFWKTLRLTLIREGIQAGTPREALKQGVAVGWLADEQLWLEMLRSRNETSHTYNEARARAVYERIKTFLPALRQGYAFFVSRLGGEPSA